MHRRTSWWAAIALGIAACADPQSPTSPVSSDAESRPRLNLSANTVANPRQIDGNISGNGTAVCSNLEVNPTRAAWLGYKEDGRGTSDVAGYRFTVYDGGRYLRYDAIAGQTQGVITAVVIKGGPDTHVYSPPLATGMRAPDNGGDNIPQISHYSVCYTQAPPPPWSVDKKLVQVYKGSVNAMEAIGPSSTVLIPPGEMRWLEFEITVTGPTGGKAKLEDLVYQACLGLVGFTCTLPVQYGGPLIDAGEIYSYGEVGPGTYKFMIDVESTGQGCPAGGTLNNVARLTPQTPVSGAAMTDGVQITIGSKDCWKVEKKLIQVYGGSVNAMIPLGVPAAGQPVVVPTGQMRWLEFAITVTGPGGTITLQDLIKSGGTCDDVKGFTCTLPVAFGGPLITQDFTFVDGNPNLEGNQPTGPGTYTFMIDIEGTGAGCPKGGTMKNTAKLTTPNGTVLTHTAQVQIQASCP